MYMAMIGMAIIAVPRGVFRLLLWLVMGVVGWFMTAVEWAYATVTVDWNGSNLYVYSDDNSDSISIYANNDCVFVSDLFNTPSMVTTDASAVSSLHVEGYGGNDYIAVSAVSTSNGFDNSTLVANGTLLGGGDNDDTIYGSALKDFFYGDDGADYLSGNGDADTIFHADGPTGANGDGDADTLVGGGGTDTGVLNAADGDTSDTEN